jgi:hypothetical protein
VTKKPTPFRSVAQRKALFSQKPNVARYIADNVGAKVGGGYTKAQLERRKAAAGRGEKYTPPGS